MISVAEVDEIIASVGLDLGTEDVALVDAVGRVLSQEVVADRDFPPFDRAMMDGIAIQFESWENGQRKFAIKGLSAAGSEKDRLESENACLEIMTGAVLPQNTDTVVKYEAVALEDGVAIIDSDHLIHRGQHIHIKGTDRLKGDLLLDQKKIISPAEIAILATVGAVTVTVVRRPKVAVIATGDELVEVDNIPLPHQIRKSNVYSLVAGLKQHNLIAESFHFNDDKDTLRRGLTKILNEFDIVVLSGGVSKGKLDYVPEILTELGVEKKLHFVKQRPGKPFWFGQYRSGVVFALPGNPVSTFVGLNRYVLPFISRSAGVEPKVVTAILCEDFTFKPDLTYFLQVRLDFNNEGQLMATPSAGQGSGDLANLLEADAFIELPTGKNEFKAGEVFRCYMYR